MQWNLTLAYVTRVAWFTDAVLGNGACRRHANAAILTHKTAATLALTALRRDVIARVRPAILTFTGVHVYITIINSQYFGALTCT